jgi:hypothetical protein
LAWGTSTPCSSTHGWKSVNFRHCVKITNDAITGIAPSTLLERQWYWTCGPQKVKLAEACYSVQYQADIDSIRGSRFGQYLM